MKNWSANLLKVKIEGYVEQLQYDNLGSLIALKDQMDQSDDRWTYDG
jgi:putative aminopeptidase FrvX